MVETFTTKLARLIAPHFIHELEENVKKKDTEVNQRVAELINNMDPYEPYMRRFKGVFSKEYENPETRLNDAGRIGMWMWAWQQDTDIHFKFLTDWIINTQANATIKRKAPTPDEILYCRAKITGMIQFRDEIRRLANLYRDHLDKDGEHEDEYGASVVE